ncbi:RIP metalloprotease RseP [Candidatus Endobugula sertula]|uniref:Zinc metalloprotease n=1 Tax=Candidatus Endobugula sertula TaxID=62101 RepID=A0A1D2QQX8_9GAMM|nr:RIP metalloprotease RseP [Candidatus Endobugula sertula]
MLLTVLWFFLALGILVVIHEFGHFYIARCCGVKVLRFSVGFGKSLYSWRDQSGTEYTLAVIPLGGYVKMLDEREGEVSEDERPYAFTQKTVWQRMAIVVAGPVANFILAIVLYFVLAMIGGSGFSPVIGQLPIDGVAATAGLKPGDEIVAIDETPVTTQLQVFSRLMRRIGDTGTIQIQVKLADSSLIETLSLPINEWLYDVEQPDVFSSLGLVMYAPEVIPVVAHVESGSPAEKSGLLPDDQLVSADGQAINTWTEWVDYVQLRPNQAITLQVERQERIVELSLTPRPIKRSDQIIGQVGVRPTVSWPESMIRPVTYTLSEAVVQGFSQTWQQSQFILLLIKKLLLAEVSTKNLGGSFTIAKVAGDSAKAGFSSYLAFLAFLSVSLGVFNLLPIPVLDGGHLLYYVIEVFKGSPVSENIQLVGYWFGLFFVLGIMILAHVNDLVRLFA